MKTAKQITVKDYYTRQVIGVYTSKQKAAEAINKLGMLHHHSKGDVIVAIA